MAEAHKMSVDNETRKGVERLNKMRRFLEKWDRMLKGIKPSEEGFATKSVREDRDSH